MLIPSHHQEPSFALKSVEPCADYPGMTLEGVYSGISLNELEVRIGTLGGTSTLIEQAQLLICHVQDAIIYFRADGAFTMQRIVSEDKGLVIAAQILTPKD